MINPKELVLILGIVLWNIYTCNGLTPNGLNVDTYYDYSQQRYTTSCKFLGWGRCTRYRQIKNTKYRCKSGYKSTDDKTCPYAICGGQINPTACKNTYANSHIIYSNGVRQTQSGGTCSTPNGCTGCNQGFYSTGPECAICKAITNCDLEECTTGTSSTCSRCNGIVQERAGYRAYKASSDKKSCIQACSWRTDSKYCYPGSCAQEEASRCTCTSGFTEKNCNRITTKPNMLYNLVRFTGQGGVTVEVPANPSSVATQGVTWTNIVQTTNILMELRAEFKITPPARPAYVEGFAVGMISGKFTFTRTRGGRQIAQTESCGSTRSEPETSLFSCSGTISSIFKGDVIHGDELSIQFSASNGGYVKVRNKETTALIKHSLTGIANVVSQTLRIDTVKPYHCTGSTACRDTMLKFEQVNTNGLYRISWNLWQDALSGIKEYSIEFEELHAVGNVLRVKQLGPTVTVSASSRSTDLTLSKEGIYSVTLSARDHATNHRSARRKVIYDVSSVVEVDDKYDMKVTTASSWPSAWQTVKDRVSVDWTSRFINKIHHNGKWLNRIDPVSGIDSAYDDEGATNNVQGIVKFTYAFSLDKSGGSTIPNPPGAFTDAQLAQSRIIDPHLVDGDTLRFWVRAYDIKNNYKEESVTISIDTSDPVIEHLWLTKGQRVNISVHNLLELNEMTMEWLAYDEHSGLDTVSWRVFNRKWGNVLVHGIQHISAQGDSSTITECENKYRTVSRDADCYCTPGVGCYHRHFQVKPQIVDSSLPHGGIFSDKDKGVHDKDYYLEVTATNHAGLTKTVERKITIDATAPHAGAVHDGQKGEPEVDFTVSRRLHAHWDGFFDSESGVMFYRYYFGTRCLTTNDFELYKKGSNLDIIETESTSAQWTHPGEGKYFASVIAYNSAMDPSEPVCSDGVIVDYSQPSLSEVIVQNSRIVGGLAKTGGSLWSIDSQRQRTQIINTGSTCMMSATDVPEYLINLFPLKRDNGTVAQIDNTNCEYKSLSALPEKFKSMVYLYKEQQLFLNWTGTDEESGIYDYEVGLSTDDFGVEAPDILPYTSTNHHSFYFGYHLPISEGKQFYVALKAINNARNFRLQAFGPILVTTLSPVFSGGISVSLKENHLVAEWPESAFSDQDPTNLKYEVAVGTDQMKSVIQPFKEIKPNSLCPSTSPQTCAAVSLKDDLSWDLHHSHTYYVSVRVTNVAGLSVIGVSSPYIHDIHMPQEGTVLDVIPPDEEETLQINSYEDSDYQLSTTTLRARWYGFDSGIDSVTYEVGIGTEPSSFNTQQPVTVGTKLEHEFTGLSLQEHQKYFVTIIASTPAGKVTVASDGITVLKKNSVLEAVTVFDGPKCTTAGNDNPMPGVKCPGDIYYQASTSVFEAHWTSENTVYPNIAWALERKVPKTDDVWEISRDYELLGNSDSLKATGVALEPGYRYRAKLKTCVGHVCTKPVHSDGVTIIPHPPSSGSVSLRYEEDLPETGMSQIHVTMEKFRDPDITDNSEAFDVMDNYEWSLADSHNSKLLTKFVSINSDGITIEGNMMKFTLLFQKHIDFSKCRKITVRGYNKVGHSSVVSSDVKDCKAVDPAHVVPSIVIDAYGKSKGGDLGSRIALEQNAIWQKDDVEFTPYNNILSAVFPTLRHRNYTWAVVQNGQIEPTSHFKRANLMTVKDPCTIQGVLKCGHTENEYINVEFPPDEIQHGERYYICIHADEKISKFEEGTDEVNACSNGVTVDLTPPEQGTVSVKRLLNGGFQVSNTEVEISWTGFDDIEEMMSTTHPSGIAYFEVSLGSLPGSDDVVKLVNVGYTNQKIFHSLNLENGHTYYATVKGTDFVGKTTQAVSKGFVIDNTAPVLTGRQIQTTDKYIKAKTVHVCWDNAFVDVESGMSKYDVAVGSRPGFDDVFNYRSTDDLCHYITLPERVKEGYTVFISIKGYNKVLMHTVLTSRPLIVSTSAPTKGYVYDGLKVDASATDKDEDIIFDKSKMGAYWEGFHHPHSPISIYWVKAGTCPGCDDAIQQFEYGSRTDIKYEHTTFSQGVKYYTTVTACTTAGFCTQAASDGVIIDTSPPIVGRVSDGTGDVDIQFQASRSFLGAKWHGFYDPESGLHHYDWRVGTTSGGEDVFGPIHAGLGEVVYRNLPPEKQLPVGQKLYSTIRVYNKAGLSSEKTSNGFVVDDTRPTVQTLPRVTSLGSLVSNTSISRTTLSVEFLFKDEESFIERQYMSISSHVMGQFYSRASQVPGFMKGGIVTGLNLHDGSRYEIKVTACNMAALCTSATSGSVLVDSTRPKTGAFAIETERAVRLGRHQTGWMTYTDTTVTLAWLGFSDLHSGIDHYIVVIGSQPFVSNHNENDAPATVQHKTTGTDKGDEGIVQINTFNIKDLPVEGSITVTLWAVNKVGLKSTPYIRELDLYGSGRLTLRRECSPFSCEGQCVCMSPGKKCPVVKSCLQQTDSADSDLVTVKDVADLQNPSSDIDFSPLEDLLAATWEQTKSGVSIHRYEYSAGECTADLPQGIFDTATEQVWFYAGKETSAVVTVPRGKKLVSGVKYCFFVKAWYEGTFDGAPEFGTKFRIFKSNGVTIDARHPAVSEKLGSTLKELKTPTSSKDIDYQESRNTIYIDWKNRFLDSHTDVIRYNAFISTSPGGHGIHESNDLNDASYAASGLSMDLGTIYYSGVVAYNRADLMSWVYSDGVQLDVSPPTAGVVHDGTGLTDAKYQQSPSVVSASWFGFSDADSAILKYLWCVGSTSDPDDCGIMPWKDVGLHLYFKAQLDSPLASGATVYSKVQAIDVLGHRSAVTVSDGVTIDTTAPQPQSMVYLGENLMRNPSFETGMTTNSSECHSVLPLAWEGNNGSCIRHISSDSLLAKEGIKFVSVSGGIQQTVTSLVPGHQYKLTLHTGYPETVLNHHQPLEIIVKIADETFVITLDPNLCRGTCEFGETSIILWNKHSFRFIAKESSVTIAISSFSRRMEFVLDHVSLESVDYVVGAASADTEEHLNVHSFFLSHWSYIHTSWHFDDKESQVVNYNWAIGTVPGGTQIQNYTDVGRDSQGISSGYRFSHGTSIYISVMATNGAGLSTVTNSGPIGVDLTGPVFDHVYDGMVMDEDYQATTVVTVNWKVDDVESGIDYCAWAIGTVKGRSDIKSFEKVNAGESIASKDMKEELTSWPITLYTSVRCVNKAGLTSMMTSDGVKVVLETNETAVPGFRILKERQSVFSERQQCHQRSDRVRMHWDPTSGQFVSVVVGIDGNQLVDQHAVPTSRHYTSASLSGFSLVNSTVYKISSFPRDVHRNKGVEVSANITAWGQPPSVSAVAGIVLTRNGTDLVLSWRNVFSSSWIDLEFEVYIGTVLGSTDVAERISTKKEDINLTLTSKHKDLSEIFVTVAAIDSCGLVAYYSQKIPIS